MSPAARKRPKARETRTAAARNGLGPKTSAELELLGLATVESLRALGWEEVCRRWVEAFPERWNLLAFYGVLAVCEGIDWRALSEDQKASARRLKRRLGLELGLAHGRDRG